MQPSVAKRPSRSSDASSPPPPSSSPLEDSLTQPSKLKVGVDTTTPISLFVSLSFCSSLPSPFHLFPPLLLSPSPSFISSPFSSLSCPFTLSFLSPSALPPPPLLLSLPSPFPLPSLPLPSPLPSTGPVSSDSSPYIHTASCLPPPPPHTHNTCVHPLCLILLGKVCSSVGSDLPSPTSVS